MYFCSLLGGKLYARVQCEHQDSIACIDKFKTYIFLYLIVSPWSNSLKPRDAVSPSAAWRGAIRGLFKCVQAYTITGCSECVAGAYHSRRASRDIAAPMQALAVCLYV